MASLDFVYDFLDKNKENNIDYLLIVLERGKKVGKVDVFYSLRDKQSKKLLSKGLEMFNQDISSEEEQ